MNQSPSCQRERVRFYACQSCRIMFLRGMYYSCGVQYVARILNETGVTAVH